MIFKFFQHFLKDLNFCYQQDNSTLHQEIIQFTAIFKTFEYKKHSFHNYSIFYNTVRNSTRHYENSKLKSMTSSNNQHKRQQIKTYVVLRKGSFVH